MVIIQRQGQEVSQVQLGAPESQGGDFSERQGGRYELDELGVGLAAEAGER